MLASTGTMAPRSPEGQQGVELAFELVDFLSERGASLGRHQGLCVGSTM